MPPRERRRGTASPLPGDKWWELCRHEEPPPIRVIGKGEGRQLPLPSLPVVVEEEERACQLWLAGRVESSRQYHRLKRPTTAGGCCERKREARWPRAGLLLLVRLREPLGLVALQRRPVLQLGLRLPYQWGESCGAGDERPAGHSRGSGGHQSFVQSEPKSCCAAGWPPGTAPTLVPEGGEERMYRLGLSWVWEPRPWGPACRSAGCRQWWWEGQRLREQ